MFFTVEETNLMCCFDTSSRKRLIAEMKSLPINELDDEMAELLFHTVRKLEGITDGGATGTTPPASRRSSRPRDSGSTCSRPWRARRRP